MAENSLTGKVAVVTGGGRGLGCHVATALCGAGARVAITGRSETTLRTAAQSAGAGCMPFVCDQRDPAAIEELAQRVQETMGEVDILVNNAGVYTPRGPVATMSLEDWNEIIETNLTGVFLTTRAFLGDMLRRKRGDVVMISSMSGKRGDAGTAAYNASKFGLQGFSQALLHEVRRSNVRVMVLNPSSIDTGADDGPREGPGLHLHAADLAATVVHLVSLPGRTLLRDIEIYGTNPFSA